MISTCKSKLKTSFEALQDGLCAHYLRACLIRASLTKMQYSELRGKGFETPDITWPGEPIAFEHVKQYCTSLVSADALIVTF